MRYGFIIPRGDVATIIDLADEAEQSGWDGVFYWDGICIEGAGPMYDPWVVLGAMALRTQRVRIGAILTPPSRRRPWKLARETVTLDRLSEGRLILGVGIGSDFAREYSAFGEAADDKLHGAMLDEALAVLVGLWSGEPFSYTGQHYTVREARFQPTPSQTPRIPIWVAGVWPNKAPFRRAARWDGVVPLGRGDQTMKPDEIRAMLAFTRDLRASAEPLDVAIAGYTGHLEAAAATALLDEYAEAGLTWWQEGFLPGDTLDDARRRIHAGPPRTSRG